VEVNSLNETILLVPVNFSAPWNIAGSQDATVTLGNALITSGAGCIKGNLYK
jgi:hypothetical protein